MITFDNVSKKYGDASFALQDISFEVEPGEFVFVTGPSGSGKTTIMRLLTREYQPTSGEIYLDNQPLSQVRTSQVHQLRRQIGVVFQDYKLLPELNVWENIALALSIIGKPQAEIEERVTDLLELVKLTDKAFLFPSQLSGGEAQRISIARALATAPAVIFADEPTGNLDPETSLEIAKLLKKIHELGTTVLFATHDTNVLSLLDKERKLVIQNGKLVEDTKQKSTKKKKADHTETVESPSTDKKAEELVSESESDPKSEPKQPTSEDRSDSQVESKVTSSKPQTRVAKFFGSILPSKTKKSETEIKHEEEPPVNHPKVIEEDLS